jgi:hypothetical protein
MEAVLERQGDSAERLSKFKSKVAELPLVTETSPWSMVETLSERLST